MFLYGSNPPETPTFAPSLDSDRERESAETGLWDTARELLRFRDNANAEDAATGEAYERRNKAIFEATGVQLPNPRRGFSDQDLREGAAIADAGGDPWQIMQKLEANWQRRAADLARERPEFASIIAADRPIADDAAALARGAETDAALAQQRAVKAGVDPIRSFGLQMGGSLAGSLRDPMQIGALFAGGGFSAPARTVVGRTLQTVFAEAVVNGGVEAGLQAASQNWRQTAGLESGIGPALEQVGMAALFGAGFGGLLQSGREVFRLTGRAAPAEVMARIEAGEPDAGDLAALASALDVELDADTARAFEIAVEQQAMDRDAFGPLPDGIDEATANRLAAEAIRAIETPPDPVLQRSAEIESIVRAEFPPMAQPPKPVTLMQFLARGGGLQDHGGELAAMGLTRKFVQGSGAMSKRRTVLNADGTSRTIEPRFVGGAGQPLVRKSGRTLDMAREAAAEEGYFDHIYGTPERAVAESTVDDLLVALREEEGGNPYLSARNSGSDRIDAWQEFQSRHHREARYRKVLEEVDAAIAEYGLERGPDDRLLRRAAELVDDETDLVSALERAIEEDYRSELDADAEFGREPYDDSDLPFFDADWQDAGPVPGTGAPDGRAGQSGERSGSGEAQAGNRGQLSLSGADEGTSALRRPGETPEPATPEAGDLAALALTEATPPKVEAAAPGDLWDAMPAARTADGEIIHTTYDDMIAEADRESLFGDLIASCKD